MTMQPLATTDERAAAALSILDGLIRLLADPEAPLEDKAASYAVVQQLRLRADRALKSSRDDIIVGMERAGLKSIGPVSVRSSAVDPRYVCNEPGNWVDYGVQAAMTELMGDRATRPYVRQVPGHMEIDVDLLTADMQMGVQAALDLYRALNDKGWRKEEARRLSLAVRERKGTA